MDTPQTYQIFSSAEKLEQGTERPAFTDPWTEMDTGQERRDTWLLSYIDILTLLLTLFVLLLVLQPKYESPATDAVPEITEVASLKAIEQKPAASQQKLKTAVEQSLPIAEVVDGNPQQTLSKDLEVDTATVMVERELSIAMLGPGPFFALAPLTPPKQDTEVAAEARAPEVGSQPEETPADLPEASVPEPPPDRVNYTESNAFDAVMAKLTEHSLDQWLKVSQIAEGVHLEVRDNILFAVGSSQLKPEGRHLLNDLAEVLLQHQGVISVEGHTDNRPISSKRFPSNWELSSGRATTVTRYLIEHDLDSAQLRAVGYADTRPLESNDTPEGRARNRRVSLILEFPQGQ